ncbi:MAG: hypothetical protein OYH77_05970 [Pseudomonadota bacterium]|nr:hypothetical protein [Pseudomonadota bacterium]
MKLKSVISLFAAALLAVSCGTYPADDGYTTASVSEQAIDQLEQEHQDGSDTDTTDAQGDKQRVVIVSTLAVAGVCLLIPGCRVFAKDGLIRIKDGAGNVIDVAVKKPFKKLFKKGDDVAKSTDEVPVKTSEEVTKQAAKSTDETAETAAETAEETPKTQG